MRYTTYRYNIQTCQYERVKIGVWNIFWYFLGLVVMAIYGTFYALAGRAASRRNARPDAVPTQRHPLLLPRSQQEGGVGLAGTHLQHLEPARKAVEAPRKPLPEPVLIEPVSGTDRRAIAAVGIGCTLPSGVSGDR